jgi:F-type H+-transporting ATPase subunit c
MDFKYIAIACTILGMVGAAIGVSKIFCVTVDSIARNPSAEDKMKAYAMVGAGMTEAMGIFSLVIALVLIFKA